jgi:hypothetical protein
MPDLSFSKSPNQNSLGFIELNPRYRSCQLNIDASSLPGASSVVLEITRPNVFFALPNAINNDPSACLLKEYPETKSKIYLSIKDFPASGIYEARLRALNSQRQQVGFAGDHIVITVTH